MKRKLFFLNSKGLNRQCQVVTVIGYYRYYFTPWITKFTWWKRTTRLVAILKRWSIFWIGKKLSDTFDLNNVKKTDFDVQQHIHQMSITLDVLHLLKIVILNYDRPKKNLRKLCRKTCGVCGEWDRCMTSLIILMNLD